MNTKKTIFKTCLTGMCLAFGYISMAQTATWTGAINQDWNNPGNWTWSDGSTGVPSATTDVAIFGNTDYPPVVSGQGSCKDLSFPYDPNGGYPGVYLADGAKLSIYGNVGGDNYGSVYGVDLSTFEFELNTEIAFVGTGDQTLIFADLEVGRVRVEKPAGNVLLEDETYLISFDSTILSSSPVTIGQEAVGNIIANNGLIYLNAMPGTTVTSAASAGEIPPHIIATSLADMEGGSSGGVLLVTLDTDFEGVNGLTGTMTIPMGANVKSYNPVTIGSQGNYAWLLSVNRPLPTPCTGNEFLTADAVQNVYRLVPLELEEGMPLTETPEGTDISFSFNVDNINEDVNTGFNGDNDPLQVWSLSSQNCYNGIDNISQTNDGNRYTVTAAGVTDFENISFVLSPQADETPDITVSTQGGTPAVITTAGGTLQMVATISPSSANQDVTWTLIPVTGAATISNSGLVTASADGIVYAKATSVADPSRADSMLITISNQNVSVDEIAKSLGFKCYPNPAGEQLFLSMSQAHTALNISVTDITGREMLTARVAANSLKTPYAVSLSGLNAGIYFLNIYGENIHFTTKVVKE